MSLRKILLSVFSIGVVAVVAVYATQAFFSDEEKSVGNTFVAGAIDLKISNTSYGFDWNDPLAPSPTGVWGQNNANTWSSRDLNTCGPDQNLPCLFFSFDDLKPGDYGEDTIDIVVQDNNAWACMAFDLNGTPENGIVDPESEAGDVAGDPNDGELQNYLNFAFWLDDGDNVYEGNEGDLLFSGLASAMDGQWQAIAESGDPVLVGGQMYYVGKFWCFGTLTPAPVAQSDYVAPTAANTGFTCSGVGDQNDAQTDGIVVDVSFYAVQSRNNQSFVCSSLPTPTPGGGG